MCDNDAHPGYEPFPLLLHQADVYDFLRSSSAVLLFLPWMRAFGVILQIGWSWTSLYSPRDCTIFNVLLWSLPVTLPCWAGGQLTDIPWQTEMPQTLHSFSPLQRLPWKDDGEENWTEQLWGISNWNLLCCCKCTSLLISMPQLEQLPKKSS